MEKSFTTVPYNPSKESRSYVARIRQICEAAASSGGAKKMPRHVAVIMDGNGRWAQERGLPRIEGHRAGIDSVRMATRACRYLEIPYLTLYAFSSENWKRPRTEVAALMRLLKRFLVEEIPEMVENEIRLSTIGNLQKLPLYTQRQLEKTRSKTREGEKMQLTLALSYGSRDEISRAVQAMAEGIRGGKVRPEEITPELISSHLDTADMPDPDLMIRTSGEFRVSNFLLWQLAYSEIHIADVAWPDFRDVHFYRSILDYLDRDRRFGKVKSG